MPEAPTPTCTGTPACEKAKTPLTVLPQRTEKQGLPVYVCEKCDRDAHGLGLRQ